MDSGDRKGDLATPAEERLDEHMELVRSHHPVPSPRLDRGIFHRLRWQRVLLVPLRAGATIAAAVAHGLRILLGGRPR